jgi:hypothetical protein
LVDFVCPQLTGISMAKTGKRVALYCRVSTKDKGQTTDNQRLALEQWATNAGYNVVASYEDEVSGAKGRDKRPRFDALLKAAVRREFDVIAVWSSDRLGRSMPHLIDVLETIKGTGVGLYIHAQALDTTTPGKHVRREWFNVTLDEAMEAIQRAAQIVTGTSLKGRDAHTLEELERAKDRQRAYAQASDFAKGGEVAQCHPYDSVTSRAACRREPGRRGGQGGSWLVGG